MTSVEPFRMRVEGVFALAGRGTVVVGVILRGAVSIGDELTVVGRSEEKRAAVIAIDPAPRDLRMLEDGLSHVGLLVSAWSVGDVREADVVAAAGR